LSGALTVVGNSVMSDVSAQNMDLSGALTVVGNSVMSDVSCQHLDVSGNLNVTGETATGNLTLKASPTITASNKIPVFIADPVTNAQTLVTRTPTELRSDIDAASTASASDTVTGLVDTTTQTFSGNKTFSDNITFSGTLNNITTTEFYRLDGVTGNIQSQISSKLTAAGVNKSYYFDSLETTGYVSARHNAGYSTPAVYSNYKHYSSGFSASSDDRVKYNEIDISNSLDIIRQLKPKKYDKTAFITDISYNGIVPEDSVRECGFIAQEILEIDELKDYVNGGDYLDESYNLIQNKYSLDYNSIFTYGIASIQELDIKYKELEEKYKLLEEKYKLF